MVYVSVILYYVVGTPNTYIIPFKSLKIYREMIINACFLTFKNYGPNYYMYHHTMISTQFISFYIDLVS